MNLKEIIDRLKNHPANELALVWVANNYSKLDLIKDLEVLAEDKPYQASVCTECPDARRRKMVDEDTTTDEEIEEIWKEFCLTHKTLIKSSETT